MDSRKIHRNDKEKSLPRPVTIISIGEKEEAYPGLHGRLQSGQQTALGRDKV